jgi:hypothetical protein
MQRTHPLDPLRPGLSLGRVTSGLIGGAAGGLAFGTLMLANFTINRQLGGSGMIPQMQELLGTSSPALVWGVHMGTSVMLGLIFSFFIAPQSYRSSILWAVGYSLVVGFVLSQVILRQLTGTPFDPFDAGAVFAFVGHLVYGFVLGVVYVSFHNLEVREAMDASSDKWRAWGDREAHAFDQENVAKVAQEFTR